MKHTAASELKVGDIIQLRYNTEFHTVHSISKFSNDNLKIMVLTSNGGKLLLSAYEVVEVFLFATVPHSETYQLLVSPELAEGLKHIAVEKEIRVLGATDVSYFAGPGHACLFYTVSGDCKEMQRLVDAKVREWYYQMLETAAESVEAVAPPETEG